MLGQSIKETSRQAFAAFRDAVFDDIHLMRKVRNPRPIETYVAEMVAVGKTMGFCFDAENVNDALHVGAQAWLMQGVVFEP